jgi:RNA polymerase sigma-70 factor (ECF subfamily)
MDSLAPHDVTQLLLDWSDGDRAALDKLVPIVHDELRALAHSYMRRERAEHTLQTTALVNEAYVRLVDCRRTRWQNRAHFFGVAAQAMRRILVDYARARSNAKRGGGEARVPLEDAAQAAEDRPAEFVALDEALAKLEGLDPRKARVVELRFFGGLSGEETAEVLGLSPATVQREWQIAKLWLLREVSESGR